MEVPVPDLLQVSHPGYRLVVARPHLNDKDIMSIVDYAQRMAERFEHYGQIVVTAPFLFEMLKQSFDTLLTTTTLRWSSPCVNSQPVCLKSTST